MENEWPGRWRQFKIMLCACNDYAFVEIAAVGISCCRNANFRCDSCVMPEQLNPAAEIQIKYMSVIVLKLINDSVWVLWTVVLLPLNHSILDSESQSVTALSMTNNSTKKIRTLFHFKFEESLCWRGKEWMILDIVANRFKWIAANCCLVLSEIQMQMLRSKSLTSKRLSNPVQWAYVLISTTNDVQNKKNSK